MATVIKSKAVANFLWKNFENIKEKFSANIIRYYTNKVHLRGLIKIKVFEPTKVGFVCVAAISNRQEKKS
ncbi:MAG: hypothetical protein ACRC78_05160 [Planktothrix sp.]